MSPGSCVRAALISLQVLLTLRLQRSLAACKAHRVLHGLLHPHGILIGNLFEALSLVHPGAYLLCLCLGRRTDFREHHTIGIRELLPVRREIDAQKRIAGGDLVPDLFLFHLVQEDPLAVFAEDTGEGRILPLEDVGFCGKDQLLGNLVQGGPERRRIEGKAGPLETRFDHRDNGINRHRRSARHGTSPYARTRERFLPSRHCPVSSWWNRMLPERR